MTHSEFEHIAPQLREKVLKVGLDFWRSKEDAEDTAQETMVQLWRYCEHIDAERNVEALAAKVARNYCVSMYRKRHPSANIDPQQLHQLEGDDSPLALLEAEDMQQMLTEAVAQLKPRERQLFEMRHTDDLSTEEIAAQTGIPKTSVAAMVSAARRKVIITLRIILSTAAVYLVGLYLWLQQKPATTPQTVAKGQPTVSEDNDTRCMEGTPLEQAQCYLEHQREQPKTYSIIKQVLYENQQ
jgi:RNA polymerase sigma factor (sigma-70 family)